MSPIYVDEQGQIFHLFNLEYQYDGKRWHVPIYALSWGDAINRLRFINLTGTIAQIVA